MAEESPIMEEAKPKEETEVKEVQVSNDDELLEILKAHGATEGDKLEGKLKAGTEVGQMANLLGTERQLNEQLRQENAALKAQPLRQQEENLDLDNMDGQTVDLEAVVSRSVEKVIQKREQRAAQLQQQQMAAWGKITNDRNYDKVKSIWDEKLKDPSFYNQIYTGQIDPVDAYRGVVDDYKDGLLRRSYETITTLKGGTKPTPPHMESGERASQNLVEEKGKGETDGARRFKELQDKVNKGYVPTPDEEEALAGAVFGI